MHSMKVLREGGMRNRFRYQFGAEIVEFLITLPVILIVVAIIVDFGVALSDQAILTNATQAAVREVIQGASDAQAQQAADLITPSLLSYSSTDPLPAVTVNRMGTDPGDTASVSITHEFDFFLLPHFLGGITHIDLTATTVMMMMPQ
ncbi:MAG: pilus assembly protein [Candidatus Thiodiazotropha sp. (ex Dulcina madagascariensis)]|nr:pilus assembly protein [Candidatus Thiodiazotropha sp. (ex Dulcina madagascariensis)]